MIKKGLKFFICFIAACMVIYACSDSSGLRETDTVITLSKTELEFDSNESSQTIKISSNAEWYVSSEVSWCHINPTKGSFDAITTISVESNTTESERTATLTFICGNASVKLHIKQYGSIKSQFVDLKLEDEYVNSSYDTNTGILTIEYKDGEIPQIGKGNSFVLPHDYEYGIRVVEKCETVGNKITLQTVQGNMCDLFRNIDFTLTTNPDLLIDTRSTGRVITPSSITIESNGKTYIVWDQSKSPTRDVWSDKHKILSFDKDYNGEELAKGDWGTLAWDKCSFNIGLDGVFYFDFGEQTIKQLIKGEFKTFKYYLEGNLDIDLLLRHSFLSQYENEVKEIIKKDVIPSVTFKFIVGGIIVPVTVKTNLGKRINLASKGETSASFGANFHATTKVGLEYRKDSKEFTPFSSWNTSFKQYDPTLNIHSTAEMTACLYPELNIKFYNFLGPWIDIFPYMGGRMKAGSQISLQGNNYANWTADLFSGIDLTLGLSLDFGILNMDAITPKNIKGEEKLICKVPAKIEHVYPDKSTELFAKQQTEVGFKVMGQNFINNEFFPVPNTIVKVTTEGYVDSSVYITDNDGLVRIPWTPIHESDKLKAEIVNSDGITIDEAIFSPKIKIEDDYFYTILGTWERASDREGQFFTGKYFVDRLIFREDGTYTYIYNLNKLRSLLSFNGVGYNRCDGKYKITYSYQEDETSFYGEVDLTPTNYYGCYLNDDGSDTYVPLDSAVFIFPETKILNLPVHYCISIYNITKIRNQYNETIKKDSETEDNSTLDLLELVLGGYRGYKYLHDYTDKGLVPSNDEYYDKILDPWHKYNSK